MNRNTLGMALAAVLLSLLASSAQPAPARDQTGARQAPAVPDLLRSLLSEARQKPTDFAERGRHDAFEAMAKLSVDACQAGLADKDLATWPQPPAAAPNGVPETAWWKALLGQVYESCRRPRPDQFLIAVVPDPIHTRLAIFFDRIVETVQQALQDEGYQFVGAVLPWDHRAHAELATFEDRLAADRYTLAKAEIPGLMTFRRSPQDPAEQYDHLFVLIVGESPTGGIAKRQFVNAVRWISAASGSDHQRPDLRILGPTFTGSLASLAELLSCKGKPCYGRSRIFSGSVSKRSAVLSFLDREPEIEATFASFQEATEVMIDRFRDFLEHRGYQEESIAIVSEDETEYGYGRGRSSDPDIATVCKRCVQLVFPREISRLRAAYQGSGAKDASAEAHAPRDVLPLNLEISGADDDTVPAFSKQTPLSQEGVLLGIVSELRKHASRFIVLRATDWLDLLFLSRYLAAAYPQGRIVTLGADVLFPREVEDKQLNGILALSTYALSPVANHEFLNYARHSERIFPSNVEAGAYNALRSLLATPAAGGPPSRPVTRIELASKGLDLYQYGWRDAILDGRALDDAKTPPVHLLALGRDEYWPIAHLGPIEPGLNTLLPKVKGPWQFQREAEINQFVVHLPMSWKVAELTAVLLALAFVCALVLASVRSTTQPFAQLAPAAADARASLIAAAAFFLECIFLLLAQPLVAGGDLLPIEHATTWVRFSWAAGLVVLAATLLDLGHRAWLVEHCTERPQPLPACYPRACAPRWCGPILFLLVVGLTFTLRWCQLGPGGELSVRRFAALRSLQLTSGLSPTLPILLMLAAGLWWAFHITAGSALLLDGRRPQLPKGVRCERARQLAEDYDAEAARRSPRVGDEQARPAEGHLNYVVSELLSTLPPRPSRLGHYLALSALAGSVALLLDHGAPLMTLEDRGCELLLSVLFLLSGAWIVGTTARLWEIWVKTRRLLVLLDSRPLRSGFKELEGFSCKTLWRISLVTTVEYQSLLARLWEALGRASHTVPWGLTSAMEKTSHQRHAVLELWKDILGLPGLRNWSRRREKELLLIEHSSCLQDSIALAAGRALDFLAVQWDQDKEGQRRRPREESEETLQVRACERFVCMVYVGFLLVVLMRIRSLTMAIAGMYILVWVGINSYPFQPRATIAALSALLLTYIIAVVTAIFAQMHRDNILSHLTNTKPGELGKAFWIRTASFAALPLFSYLAAQFPQINRSLYSWLEPAVQALHK